MAPLADIAHWASQVIMAGVLIGLHGYDADAS
jgi:hypothetical protein